VDHIKVLCKSCMKKEIGLDLKVSEDVAGPADGRVILFIHGALANRKLYEPYLLFFANAGYRCVAIDLPGHGGRYKEELSLDSALDVINEAGQRHSPDRPFVLFGLSLGGYLSYAYLAKHPERVCGALIGDSSQRVGPNRGLMASVGLWGMNLAADHMSSKTVLKFLANQVVHQMDPELLASTTLRIGLFSHAQKACVQILKSVEPDDILPEVKVPVCLAYGNKDHHDGQKQWMGLLGSHGSELEYNGDHFFCHNKDIMPRFLDDCLAWLKRVDL
jgi:pimeloyl-ACP methyl ester carboxylesterase